MNIVPIDTQAIVRFTPPSYKDREDAPVYLMQPPSIMQRANWRRDLMAMGATYPTDEQLIEGMRRVIRQSGSPNTDEALDLIDRFVAAKAEGDVGADLADAFAGIEQGLQQVPAYGELVARRMHWLELAPILAARNFITGWEGLNLAFRRVNGRLPDELLNALPEEDVKAVGMHIIGLMTVNRTLAGNSASPSSNGSDPSSSTDAKPSKTAATAGRSKKNATKATRAG